MFEFKVNFLTNDSCYIKETATNRVMLHIYRAEFDTPEDMVKFGIELTKVMNQNTFESLN